VVAVVGAARAMMITRPPDALVIARYRR